MKVPSRITGLLVIAIIAASTLTCCATQQKVARKPSRTISPKPAGQDISGEWHVVDSTARFKISIADGVIHIEGCDSSTGEKFRISDVQWDGRRLQGIFVLPSMKSTKFSNLLLMDPNTLKGRYKGSSSGEEVWKRESISAAPAPAGFATQQKADTKPSETISPKPAGQDISGEWHVVDSTARFKIFFADEVIHIEGWDSGTGEKFRISNVQWDGRRLQGIFVVPSTKNTIFWYLVLIDPNTFKGSYLGNSSGAAVWKREAISAASTLTGSAMQQKADTKPLETIPPKPAGQDISGEWHVVDSTARFTISFVDGVIHIEGWDSSDGERFRISDVQWDGKRLKGTFVMPSTNGTTYSNLVLIDANTLKGPYKGDSSGVEVWKRQ